ncbi:MAG: hypothetical protein OXF84_05840 [Bacteroidetes bacterium]|nr:hypothetical protein [Bacteroidota bacterium]
MITSIQELQDLCARMESSSEIALDTEFISGRYPDPVLCVVQVGFDNSDTFLIDALAFDDLSALSQVLESHDIVKIMHDAGQDLCLIANRSGAVPQNIFDVKRAARLLGAGMYYSLQEIVNTFLGIRLSKKHQWSDWLQRPLSKAQIRYAKLDVQYLHQIRDGLLSRAHKMGRQSWIQSEMLLYNDPVFYTPLTSAEKVLRLSAAYGLRPAQRAAVASVVNWRTHVSETRSIHPKKLLKDVDILRVAHRECVDIESVRKACPGLPRQYHPTIAQRVEKALKTPDHQCPPSLAKRPLTSLDHAKVHLMQSLVALRAHEHAIEPDLIGSSSKMRDFVLDPEHPPKVFLDGWRREIIGVDLMDMIQGRCSIEIQDGVPTVVRPT